jgi:hypothetical protein
MMGGWHATRSDKSDEDENIDSFIHVTEKQTLCSSLSFSFICPPPIPHVVLLPTPQSILV